MTWLCGRAVLGVVLSLQHKMTTQGEFVYLWMQSRSDMLANAPQAHFCCTSIILW